MSNLCGGEGNEVELSQYGADSSAPRFRCNLMPINWDWVGLGPHTTLDQQCQPHKIEEKNVNAIVREEDSQATPDSNRRNQLAKYVYDKVSEKEDEEDKKAGESTWVEEAYVLNYGGIE